MRPWHDIFWPETGEVTEDGKVTKGELVFGRCRQVSLSERVGPEEKIFLEASVGIMVGTSKGEARTWDAGGGMIGHRGPTCENLRKIPFLTPLGLGEEVISISSDGNEVLVGVPQYPPEPAVPIPEVVPVGRTDGIIAAQVPQPWWRRLFQLRLGRGRT